jgi:endoglucanase
VTREGPGPEPTTAGRGGLTRRHLLAGGTAGAVALLASERACRSGVPSRAPVSAAAPYDGRGVLRGVNSYTLAYASVDGRTEGEPAHSYAYLAGRGHRIVRLPFEWGRIQPRLGGPLDEVFLAGIEAETAAISDAGMRVILDVHSSGRHPTKLSEQHRFGRGIAASEFADLWLRLSDRFADDPRIHAYDLMNEPFGVPDAVWQEYSQRAVTALRESGDRTPLWIEGNELALASGWREHQPVAWIDDPLERIVYSAHTYPGGAAMQAQRAPRAADQAAFLADLRDFTAWLSEFGVRGCIGEVGWPSQRHVGRDGALEWNRLADAWFAIADSAGLDVTYFGASSAYDNWLWAYDAPRNEMPVPGLSVAESQATVIEAHPSRARAQRK